MPEALESGRVKPQSLLISACITPMSLAEGFFTKATISSTHSLRSKMASPSSSSAKFSMTGLMNIASPY
jgi:hypothetical protein